MNVVNVDVDIVAVWFDGREAEILGGVDVRGGCEIW